MQVPNTRHTMSHPPPLAHAQFEVAKWLAVVTMTIDHYGKIVDPSIYSETNAIGRIAFPLFAWIIGARLAIDPSLAGRYLRYLIPWALLTQPIYIWVGKGWAEPNILFILASGVSLHWALEESRDAIVATLVVTLVLALLVVGADHGMFGLVMIPIVARLSRISAQLSALSAGPIGVSSNLLASPPYLGPGAIWALLASVLASLSLRYPLQTLRMPKLFFYAYYPSHLMLLQLAALLLESGSVGR